MRQIGERDVRICLIGTGRAGMIHGRNIQFKIPTACIVAVADPVESACEKACQELKIDKFYLDYKDVFLQRDIDAVIVAVPTKYHRDIVVKAASAKKHILCEKPMAMCEAECDEMIQAAEKNSVKLQLGFVRRFDYNFIAAKQAIENGEIGEIVHIRSLTRGPSKPLKWMYDTEKGNGALAEVNSHDIDCIRWLTGSEFKHVYVAAGNYRNKEIAQKWPMFYDNVVMTGVLENGVLVTIEGAQYVKYGYDARVEVLGTKGVIHIGRQNAYDYKVVSKQYGVHNPFISSWKDLFAQAYLEEDSHFVDCILNDKEPIVTGVDGKMVTRIVTVGNQSIQKKKIVFL